VYASRTLKLALAVIAVFLALPLLVRIFEARLAFFPIEGETLTPREFGVEFERISVVTKDGERLQAWRLLHPSPRALVVYFHGNGGNLSVWAPILSGIARQGYSVLAFDYRGYGGSTGRPSESGLYKDVEAVVQHFWERTDRAAPVIYWGRSLGTVMAAYASTIHAPNGLILESGFPDARSLVRSSPVLAFLAMFSSYRFTGADFLAGAAIPVLVVHGDNDHVVPFNQGRALFDRVTGPKQFFMIRGGDHNDAAPRDPEPYWKAVGQLAADAEARMRANQPP
jgi:fermentation-respiration switch protein FrsA (DUF1100 family)